MKDKKKTYLDFERPIAALDKKIEDLKTRAETENIDMSAELSTLEKRLQKVEKEIYSDMSRWQIYQVAGHPQRPHTLDYIRLMLTDFMELHGDRTYGDDPAVVSGFARLDGQPILVLGTQKGRNTRENIHRNFGMAHPEGYRKALRVMKLAAKFKRPVLCLIDTPGAYPGIGSEERSVSEAIARNLLEIFRLPVPIIVVIIGEGASGGALGIGVGDRILMLENAWYSVINPQSCSLILWRNRDKREEAAEALKITAPDLVPFGIVDRIVPEPFGGAHRDPVTAGQNLKRILLDELQNLLRTRPDILVRERVDKFGRMGVWDE
jgi:acetyl-CoA carboxylase carboxyl transferase subunit alpha